MSSTLWSVRHELSVAGFRINAYVVGSGTPVFLLVHGLGTSPRYFEPLAAHLASTGTVIAVELPGFGRTPKPDRGLTIKDFAGVVSGVLDHLEVGAAVLVGHSMGAQIAAEVAILRPEQTERLVLLGPTVDNHQRTAVGQALRLGRDWLHESAGANGIVFTDYFRAGTKWYLRTLPQMLKHRIEDVLAHVRCPVQLVRGERDTVAPVDWLRRLQRVCPQAVITEVPAQPHVVMYPDPTPVARACLQIGAPR